MTRCTAVLLDTVAIQPYIFQSNKLRENLGASFLVAEIYKSHLANVLTAMFGKADINAWKNSPEELRIRTEPFEVGYIGGGNALLFFQEEATAKAFIRAWTKTLLLHAPGIVTAVALDPQFDLDNFAGSRRTLSCLLQQNKGRIIPQTLLPAHGITASCSHSKLTMDVWNETAGNPNDIVADRGEYISAMVDAKIKAAHLYQRYLNQQEQDDYHDEYHYRLPSNFGFTNDIDRLGQVKDEDSHIAIVHIDGNEMGTWFDAVTELSQLRKLSKAVDEAVKKAFAKLIEHIAAHYEETFLPFLKITPEKMRDQKTGKQLLPIRPIILGGDDITFVCDGKLGIYFAKRFIKYFEQQPVNYEKKLTACAGIAVIKTKYPFYRGYKLAEDLCHEVKKERKEKGDPCSYLDFHIATGGVTAKLSALRAMHFQSPQGNLLYRPYKLVPAQTGDMQSLEGFIGYTQKFVERTPKNKRYELREVLTRSEAMARQFVQQLKTRKVTLPDLPGRDYAEKLFDNGQTPYFDMIELSEYYPLSPYRERLEENEA